MKKNFSSALPLGYGEATQRAISQIQEDASYEVRSSKKKEAKSSHRSKSKIDRKWT